MSKKLKCGQTYDKHKSLLKDESKGIYIYTRLHGTRHSHSINVEVPYNEVFIKEIKLLDGSWMKKDKVWRTPNDFDTKEKVCGLVDRLFGTSLKDKLLAHKKATDAGISRANEKDAEEFKNFFAKFHTKVKIESNNGSESASQLSVTNEKTDNTKS
jgi:hypothetical protein